MNCGKKKIGAVKKKYNVGGMATPVQPAGNMMAKKPEVMPNGSTPRMYSKGGVAKKGKK